MAFNKKHDTVAVTGVAGFVGSRALFRMNWDGYSKIVGTDIRAPEYNLPPGVAFDAMDITNKDSVRSFFEKHRPRSIINIAAVFDFAASPKLLYNVNVNGPLNLLEIGEEYGLEHLVQTSTGTVYHAGRMLTEESRLGPIEPYGESKLLMENQLSAYTGDVKISMLRSAVVYGPQFPSGSKYGAALALFAQYALAKFGMGITGFPIGGDENEACYVHVDDAVRAHTFMIENDLTGIYNIVDQTPVTHKQLGQIVLDTMDLPWYHGLLKGRKVPLPEKPLMALGELYEKITPRLESHGITIPLDKGAFTYMFGGDFSMSPAKLVSEGFVHLHPSAFRSMPPVVREYIDSNWEILVGEKVAKILRHM